MRTRILLAAGVLAIAGAAFLSPGCTKEREKVQAPESSGAGNPIGGTNPASGSGGEGGGGEGGQGGAGGEGGNGGDGGGGGPETLPQCACLLDISATEACGTCVSFGVVDECGQLYSDCQGDADCVAVDNCVLDQKCEDSACLDACRDLGTSEARDLFDAMYDCACRLCRDDCDIGDDCR